MNRRDMFKALAVAPAAAVVAAAAGGGAKKPSSVASAVGSSPAAPSFSYESWTTGITEIGGRYYVERQLYGVDDRGTCYKRTEIGQEIVPGKVCLL